MTHNKATARPWTIWKASVTGTVFIEHKLNETEGETVAVLQGYGDVCDADADLIIRAVNSFELMREALESVVRDLKPVGKVKDIFHKLVAYEAAKKALSLADGKDGAA